MTDSIDSNRQAHILFCFAMLAEAQPLIQHLHANEQTARFHTGLPLRLFEATFNSMRISIATSGMDMRYGVDNIGCEPATVMAYEGIRTLSPDLIISAGTAGGFKKLGAGIGTVYLSDQMVIFHDRCVPLPGFAESALGCYPCVDAQQLAHKLNLPLGVISSGSSLRKSEGEFAILESNKVVAKEMEAAAIAWIASLFKCPFLAIKSITNLVDELNQSEDEFLQNFEQACTSLNKVLVNFLQLVDARQLAVWKQQATRPT